MWVLDASGFSAAYNMPWILDIKGNFNRELMLKALDLVVKREQPLRTILRFNKKAGIVQQKVLPKSQSHDLWVLKDHTALNYEEAVQIVTYEKRISLQYKRGSYFSNQYCETSV